MGRRAAPSLNDLRLGDTSKAKLMPNAKRSWHSCFSGPHRIAVAIQDQPGVPLLLKEV
jgi:hypothetical protein